MGQAMDKLVKNISDNNKYIHDLEYKEKAEERKFKEEQSRRKYLLHKMKIDNQEKDKQTQRQQRQSAIDNIIAEIKEVKEKIEGDKAKLLVVQQQVSRAKEHLNKTQLTLHNWPEDSKKALARYERELKAAKRDYDRDCEVVQKAIQATGVHELNVAKFLRMAHNVINAGASTRATTNKLATQISTFGAIIKQHCQTKLSIKNYFTDIEPELQGFIPILAAKNMHYLDDIKCKNEEEFESDILSILENGIKNEQKENKENDTENNAEITGSELAKELLTAWGLSRYINILLEEGWEDPIDWNDLTDDDLLELKFKKGHIKKFKREYQKWKGVLSLIERRKLKSICLESHITWEKDAKIKTKHVKQTMMTISPLLSNFFGQIKDAVKEAQIVLEYPEQLNNRQLEAIQMPQDNDDNNVDEKRNDDIEDDKQQREQWDVHSECQIFSDSEQKWYDGTVLQISNDKEGEWLTVAYRTGDDDKTSTMKQIQRFAKEIKPNNDAASKLNVECRALTKASITKFNIVESLQKECEGDTAKLMALTLATGVEDGCVAVFKSQGIIRQSVILAQSILKLKPVDMNGKTRKQLWKAVDNGIINIFNSALEMVKVSTTYFSYFLRFKSSLEYFMSCYQDDDDQKQEEMSLVVSMEYLQKDIREFDEFQQEFQQTVNQLEKESMAVIAECVRKAIGAEEFEKSKNSREKTLQSYLDRQKQYDEQVMHLGKKLNEIWDNKIEQITTLSQLEYQKKTIHATIQKNQQYHDVLANRLIKFQKTLI